MNSIQLSIRYISNPGVTFIGNMVLVCSHCVVGDRISPDKTIWCDEIDKGNRSCIKQCVEERKYDCKFMVCGKGGRKWQCEMRKVATTYKTVSNINDPSYPPSIYKQGV